MAKKQCAVCKTRVQANIIWKWRRFRDNSVFHVCALCREQGLVNEDSVQIYDKKTYSSLAKEYMGS